MVFALRLGGKINHRAFYRSLSFFKRASIDEVEALDIGSMEKFQLNIASIQKKEELATSGDIGLVINNFKNSEQNMILGSNVLESVIKLEAHLLKSFPALKETEENDSAHARLLLLKHYVIRMRKAIENGDLPVLGVNNHDILNLCETILNGTSTERLHAHISMYGTTFTQAQLQACMYCLLEPEITSCIELLKDNLKSSSPSSSDKVMLKPWNKALKHHAKLLKKQNSDYLLDVLELNVKTRCVFAWSDKTYTGFKPIDDDCVRNVDDIIPAMGEFFPEASEVSTRFLSTYIGDRRVYYNEQRSQQKNIRLGMLFFLGICVLDFGVTAM